MQRSSCIQSIRSLQKCLQNIAFTSCHQAHHNHISRTILPLLTSIRQSSTSTFTLTNALDYVQHKKTHKENQEFFKSLAQESKLEINDRMCEILALIESREIEKAVIMVNQSKLSREELIMALTHISNRKFYQNSITVYNKYQSVVRTDVQLTSIILQNSYNLKNYKVFEELFACYMQFKSTDLESHYLELGLKVHLRLNPEFAKQLLYQMVYMEYPIGKDLFYEFFRITRRYASFDVLKFGLDLLINNPSIEISDKTYGELYSSYLVEANEYDLKKFFNFLLERNALNNIEVKMAQFIDSLRRQKIDEIWTLVEKFKIEIKDKETLERFYDKLYLQIQDKLDYKSLMTYLNMLEMDGIQNNVYKYHERICTIFAKLRDNTKFLKTLEIIRDSNIELSGAYLKLFWRTLSEANPDLIPTNTTHFSQLIKDRLDPREAKRTLNEISYYKGPSGYKLQRYSKTNDLLYRRILPLLKNSTERSDDIIFDIINENIREGKRPPVFLLYEILQGYIKRKSPHTQKFISLIQDLFKTKTLDFDLLILKRDLLERENKDNRISLINKFLYENNQSLSFLHYNEIALMLINVGEFQKALEYLNYGRNSIKPIEKPDIITIYVIALKALAYKLDYKGFIALLNLVEKDNNVILSSHALSYIKGYSKYFLKKAVVEDLEEFESIYAKIKAKHSSSLDSGRETIKRTITFLKQWLNQSNP